MKSTSKTNDGFEIIPFHTLLPQADEEAQDERKTQMETRGGREGERGTEMCNASQNFFNFTDNFLCNY